MMTAIPIARRLFRGPTHVVIEASIDAILDFNLDPLEGEQYDTIFDVIAIETDRNDVTFETCRTIERPGRGTIAIPRKLIQAIYI